MTVHDQGNLPCDRVKVKLQDKLVSIDDQIQQLLILKQELEGLLAVSETLSEKVETTICPLIEEAFA